MIRALVTLLIALPQLAPPGACLCRFDLRLAREVGDPEAARYQPAPPDETDGRPCPGGCCRHHRAPEPDGAESRPQTAPQPAPADRPHDPSCPAVNPVAAHAKLAERPAPVAADPPAVAAVSVAITPPRGPLTRRPAAGRPDPSPTPAYIAFRALLI